MREPAVISNHRRVARVSHAHVRSDDDVWRPRILARLSTAYVVVERQAASIVDLAHPDRGCVVFKQIDSRGHARAFLKPEHGDVVFGCANARRVQRRLRVGDEASRRQQRCRRIGAVGDVPGWVNRRIAVLSRDDDKRVVVDAGVLERADDLTDGRVNVFDLSSNSSLGAAAAFL